MVEPLSNVLRWKVYNHAILHLGARLPVLQCEKLEPHCKMAPWVTVAALARPNHGADCHKYQLHTADATMEHVGENMQLFRARHADNSPCLQLSFGWCAYAFQHRRHTDGSCLYAALVCCAGSRDKQTHRTCK